PAPSGSGSSATAGRPLRSRTIARTRVIVGRPFSAIREAEMAVKLYRCGSWGKWVKVKAHPCWKVESALRDQGIDYEPVYGPTSRSKRTELEPLSGQRLYPVI